MNAFEIFKKGILISNDNSSNDKVNENSEIQNSGDNKKIDKSNELNKASEKTEIKENRNEDKKQNAPSERKISFNSILPEISIVEKPINSLFKLIPFNIPPKNDEKDDNNNENESEENKEPEVIILDNTDESLKIYQQKMIDLMEENKFLKNQIKEYVSKVAWLEEHFTIRQENANVQHLQELEHIHKANEKETKAYDDKIKELEDAINILQDELTRQTDLLAEEKESLTFTTSANWTLEKKVTEMEDKLKIKNSESIDLKTQLIHIKEQYETKNDEYNKIEEKYNSLKNKSESLATENERLKKENTFLNEKIKIYDNISKRSTKTSFESRYYQNMFSPTTPKSSSEYSFSLYPTSNEINNNTTNNNNANNNTNNTNNSNNENIINTNTTTTNTNNNNNKSDNIINRKNKPEPIEIQDYSKISEISSKNNSFIDDTDLNDLIDEITISETPKKKTGNKNIYEYSEKPKKDLLTENKSEDLTFNSITQSQNILTEINLD